MAKDTDQTQRKGCRARPGTPAESDTRLETPRAVCRCALSTESNSELLGLFYCTTLDFSSNSFFTKVSVCNGKEIF